MKLWIFLIFTATLGYGLSAPADYFRVGNGGEGVLLADGVYTRDLHDFHLHRAPWFGQEVEASLLAKVTAWNPLALSPEECELLARKLTDLNRFYDFFGDDVMEVLQFFYWTLTDQDLVLIEPDEVTTPVYPQQRLAIANRHLGSILIHRENFARLNGPNKVALLIHEAVYSLMHYKEANRVVGQNLLKTRQLTAGFFDERQQQSPESLLPLLISSLRIDLKREKDMIAPISDTEERSKVRVVLVSASRSTKTFLVEKSEAKEIHHQRAQAACHEFFRDNTLLTKIELEFQPLRLVNFEKYKNANGSDQFGLRIEYSTNKVSRSYRVKHNECVDLLTDTVDGLPW